MDVFVARFAAVIAVLVAGVAHAADALYDLVLRNARIVDGTGSPWFRGDLAIRGDTIARIALSVTDPAFAWSMPSDFSSRRASATSWRIRPRQSPRTIVGPDAHIY